MSFGKATFGDFIVGQASRLPSNDLRSQARRPRYIQKTNSGLLEISLLAEGAGLHSLDQRYRNAFRVPLQVSLFWDLSTNTKRILVN
jgi:hypothetical protein